MHCTGYCCMDSVSLESTTDYWRALLALCAFISKAPDFRDCLPLRQSALDAIFYNKFNVFRNITNTTLICDISGNGISEKMMINVVFSYLMKPFKITY